MENWIIEVAVKQGPLVIAMGFGLYWLNKAYVRQMEQNAALYTSNMEIQQQRISAMEEHIQKIEGKADKCQEDRIKIHEENARLAREISQLKCELFGRGQPEASWPQHGPIYPPGTIPQITC